MLKQEIFKYLNWLDEHIRPVKAPTMKFRAFKDDEGADVVEVRNLKVWIYHDGRHFVAQGLDIGYAAAGATVEETKSAFERGLVATLMVNLHRRGTVEDVVKPAAPEIWIEWRRQMRRHEAEQIRHNDRGNGSFPQFPKTVVDPEYYGAPCTA